MALGDMGEASGLDLLAGVAPVLGTLGEDDPKDDSHVERRDGVLFVNPGGPTLAEQRWVAGVGLLEAEARAEILPV